MTCPFCGADDPDNNCLWDDGLENVERLPDCYERQIESMRLEIAELKERLEACRRER